MFHLSFFIVLQYYGRLSVDLIWTFILTYHLYKTMMQYTNTGNVHRWIKTTIDYTGYGWVKAITARFELIFSYRMFHIGFLNKSNRQTRLSLRLSLAFLLLGQWTINQNFLGYINKNFGQIKISWSLKVQWKQHHILCKDCLIYKFDSRNICTWK